MDQTGLVLYVCFPHFFHPKPCEGLNTHNVTDVKPRKKTYDVSASVVSCVSVGNRPVLGFNCVREQHKCVYASRLHDKIEQLNYKTH